MSVHHQGCMHSHFHTQTPFQRYIVCIWNQKTRESAVFCLPYRYLGSNVWAYVHDVDSSYHILHLVLLKTRIIIIFCACALFISCSLSLCISISLSCLLAYAIPAISVSFGIFLISSIHSFTD